CLPTGCRRRPKHGSPSRRQNPTGYRTFCGGRQECLPHRETDSKAVCPTAMTSFYFKAVASDGKLRTGTLHAETDKWVAQELRRQGLTPVYVGVEPKKSFELKLPTLSGRKRRDVLFFTQELSTLLNA